MDQTQVKQPYEVFSILQFVTLKKYIKGMHITIYSANNESMITIHKQKEK